MPVSKGSQHPDDAPELLVEEIDHGGTRIALLTLNRPEQLNPLRPSIIRALREALENLAQGEQPAGVVVTGAGRAFSAGGDLKESLDLYRDASALGPYLDDFAVVCSLLERCNAVTVAMINGTCVAGGLEIALACDFITVAEDARIGDGHLRFAQVPGMGGSQRLVRAIGVQRARHWLLSGKLFPASVAVEAGLALWSAPPSSLRSRSFDLVSDIAKTSPLALSRMKELIRLAVSTPLEEGLARESAISRQYVTTSHDALEGVRAFAEGREPRYLGR